MRQLRLSILFLLGLSAPALAVPVITSNTGTLTQGATITIMVTGHGAKPSTAPTVYENFNSGVITAALAKNDITNTTNTTNLRTAYDVYNATWDFKAATGSRDDGYFSYNVSVSSKWFVQYWIKLADNWQWGATLDAGLGNVKFFRLFPSGARNYTNLGYVFHGDAGTNNVQQFFENNTVDNRSNLFNFKTAISTPIWHCIQIEYGEASGHGYDGYIKLWIDGALRDSSDTIRTNFLADGATIGKRPFNIGFFDSSPPSDASVTNMIGYYDDIVVDKNVARVEISSCTTYNTACPREYQLTTRWEDGSISFVLDTGAIPDGSPLIAWVTDPNGVQSASYQLTQAQPTSTSGTTMSGQNRGR